MFNIVSIFQLQNTQLAKTMLEAHVNQMLTASTGNFLLAGVITVAYLDKLPKKFTLFFLASIYFVNAVRAWAYSRRKYYFAKPLGHKKIHQLALGISFTNGVFWGFSGWFVARYAPEGETLLMYVVLAGITAGALATASASRIAFTVFTLPTLIPLTIYELLKTTPDSLALALVFSAYIVLMVVSSKRINNTIYSNVATLLENENTLTELKAQQVANNQLNQELKEKIAKEESYINELEIANLRSKQLADELYRRSTTDSLTGIANRRSLDEALEQQWRLAKRSETSIALIMFDLDWFKKYNDSMGHIAGDECLCKLAELLKQFFKRDIDLVARFGGEEFAVLLTGINEKNALVLANNFCTFLYAQNIPHNQSDFHRITTSSGVSAVIPTPNSTPIQLVEQADKALYSAKANGRNTARCFSQL